MNAVRQEQMHFGRIKIIPNLYFERFQMQNVYNNNNKTRYSMYRDLIM